MIEELKKGWAKVAFGDVVQLVKGRSGNPEADGFERYVGLEHLDPGELKIRRWGDIADGTTFTSVFRAGQVLFGKRRAYQRKLAVADFDGVCSGDIYVFEPKNSQLLPELLPFICLTDNFFEHAIGTSAGSLSPRTNWKSIAEYEFALPPMEEQRKYLSAFHSLLLYKNTLIYALQKLSSIVEKFQMVFVNKNNAEKVFIKDICILKGGSGFPPKYQGNNSGELPFYKVSDMNSIGNNKYMRDSANYISIKDAIGIKANILPPESIVFAKVGAALLLNRRRILIKDSCIDNNMMGAIPSLNSVLPEYLWLMLKGIDFGQYVQAGAIPSINQSIIGDIIKPLPTIDEQQFIVNQALKLEFYYNLISNKIKKQDFIFSIVMGCLTDV